jgi:tRNA C32,U32 (ribose-2'-O)-methylase TrmJ
MTEKTIIEGRTIMKTVDGAIKDVSATVATATITTSGTTERAKSNSIRASRGRTDKAFDKAELLTSRSIRPSVPSTVAVCSTEAL